jgi:integrase/recombinase XerD
MCIREIDMIGKSKREFRKKGVKGIHSHKTKKEVIKISRQFANWARDRGIRNLHDLTEQEYKDFLDSKNNTTLDYRRGIETHLRLLQEGLNKRSERFGKEKVQFVTKKRLTPPKSRLEGASDRSIKKHSVIDQLQENVSQNVSNSIYLMHKMGLRVSESVSVKVCDVNFEKNTVYVLDGKGGRPRYVEIPKGLQENLAGMIEGKESHERLVPIQKGTVSNAVKSASRKINMEGYTGTHAFRHTYARKRVNELMTNEEKQLFRKCISRYAENKRFDYGVSNFKLYNSMKLKMDEVHAELGHGPNRFDLALTYMR